jgi:hypothetical protein
MSRYLMICRLRWPAFLLLTGVIALLDQANILSWGRAWPLYLILWGVLALAERALLANEQPPAGYPYAAGYAAGYAPPAYPGAAPGVSPVESAPAPGPTGIVPSHGTLDITHREEER